MAVSMWKGMVSKVRFDNYIDMFFEQLAALMEVRRPVRRWVITVLAVVCLPHHLSIASDSSGRVALVVGNSSYLTAPLANPRNDATAMAALLKEASFQVDSRIDVGQSDLQEAVKEFGRKIRDSKVNFAIFYYAGHGMQLDWRNYLIPIDARVMSAEDVRRQSVDVSELLRYMQETKNKSFLVVLDACRDDPFAGTFRAPAKGLSQFDAPVNTLLAYATSPGNVALDGTGVNGLYTSHLLREFSVKNARLEDAFKRVRLNVRVESGGKQIPWETTSLEEDLYLFPLAAKKFSAAEQEALFDKEVSAWLKVKAATSVEPLVAFIREFPSGSTNELAQARLNRLLLSQSQDRAKYEADAQAMREAERKAEEAQAREAITLAQEASRKAAEQAAQRAKRAQEARMAEQLAQEKLEAERTKREADLVIAAQRREREKTEAQQLREQELQEALRLAEEFRARQTREYAEQQAAEKIAIDLANSQEKTRLDQLTKRPGQEPVQPIDMGNEDSKNVANLPQSAQGTQMAVTDTAMSSKINHSALQLSPADGAFQRSSWTPAALPATPYFKGMDVHMRDFAVGDRYALRVVDQFTKAEKPLEYRVTKVDLLGDRVEYNDGEYTSDLMGNITRNT